MPEPSQTAPPESRARYPRLRQIPRQVACRSPFTGSIRPGRVPLIDFDDARPALPFPHPWNYREPLTILETFFHRAERSEGASRHTRYLDVPGFAPVLVTRDPRLIRAISQATGDRPGMFDRDTLPSTGIARATGGDTLLYANGPRWKHQKKVSTPPFARAALFVPEKFDEFEQTLRATVRERLEVLRGRIEREGSPVRVELEPEIKSLMLEMLVCNFFGAYIDPAEIREKYVPALDRVISHIVRDTVVNKLGIPLARIPSWTRGISETKRAQAAFEELTTRVLEPRRRKEGLWSRFESDAPDEALRANIRVFLAGALEATTSYASWAISHLARNPDMQKRLYAEIAHVNAYTPEALAGATYLNAVLDETLRLTPALYFHPRKAVTDTLVETNDGETLNIPAHTHILLDVWHANRCEEIWGVAQTGYPARAFRPERWLTPMAEGFRKRDLLHFGFGHGPRFCPGKNLGQLEVALVVGACVKLFQFEAVHAENAARAGVSTKPADGVRVELRPRKEIRPSEIPVVRAQKSPMPDRGMGDEGGDISQCPFLNSVPSRISDA
ncbi:MAG: cytochrome P450 [Phycisphaerales bacterium JB061]